MRQAAQRGPTGALRGISQHRLFRPIPETRRGSDSPAQDSALWLWRPLEGLTSLWYPLLRASVKNETQMVLGARNIPPYGNGSAAVPPCNQTGLAPGDGRLLPSKYAAGPPGARVPLPPAPLHRICSPPPGPHPHTAAAESGDGQTDGPTTARAPEDILK